MLIFGDPKCIPTLKLYFSDFKIVNFNCCVLGYPNANLLPIKVPVEKYNDQDFDNAYANYIMSDDNVFVSFFNLIIELHMGNNIFLMSNNADLNINLPESLMKFIQYRYGFNGCICEEPEDLFYAKESSFTIEGLFNFDSDRAIYLNILNNTGQLR